MRPRSMQDVLASKDYPLQRKSSRGTVRIRGLRDAMASQQVASDTVPATHAQRLSEIAWLEREAERLQRESNIIEANLQRIQQRLADIGERRDLLMGLVRESLGVVAPEPTAEPQTNKTPKVNGNIETFSFEY